MEKSLKQRRRRHSNAAFNPGATTSAFGGGVDPKPLILALDITGAPYGWVNWQNAVTLQAAHRVHRQMGTREFTFHGGLNGRTGERSVLKTSSIIALKGRNPCAWDRSPPAISNALLFSRDRNYCCYCGQRYSIEHLTRDHVRAQSRDGETSWNNLVSCCLRCNQIKGSRTPEEAGFTMHYLPYIPSRHEGLILRNRRILADQMEFLIGCVPAHSRLHG